MPVYVSFLVCALSVHGATLSNPRCYVTVPDTHPSVGIAACERDGMVLAAQWHENHHGWRVARIRCSIGNRPQPQDQA